MKWARALVQRLRGTPSPAAPIWSGVFATFRDIPSTGSGFAGNDAVEAAERLLHEMQAEPMPSDALLEHQLLAIAVRLADKSPVHVVDFGGGVGQSYAALRRLTGVALRYEVVDLPPLVTRGAEVWKGEIAFRSDIGNEPPDVLFVKSVMQYFEDYGAMLDRLFATGARRIVFEKFSGVTSRTYATVQLNVYDSQIPYWFIALDEVIERAQRAGYALTLRRRTERVYDQANFPPELRMGQTSSLLFEC